MCFGSRRVIPSFLCRNAALPSCLRCSWQCRCSCRRRIRRRKGRRRRAIPKRSRSSICRPANIAGEIPGDRASDPDKQSDWPAIAYAADGSLYAIYIEWNDKDADRVVVRRRDSAGAWGKPHRHRRRQLGPLLAHHRRPRRGRARHLVRPVERQLRSLSPPRSRPTGAASKPERLTRAPFSDFNARAVADSAGNVTRGVAILPQRQRRYLRAPPHRQERGGRRRASPPANRTIGSPPSRSTAAASPGSRGIPITPATTTCSCARSTAAKLGPQIAITTEPAAQFHSSVAVDGDDRVWVAWDEGGINWGKDFSRASSAPGSRGLHYSRKIGVRVYANGRVQNPSADISQSPHRPHVALRRTAAPGDRRLRRDLDGLPPLDLAQPHEIYHFYATRLSGDAWSVPLQFSVQLRPQHAARRAGAGARRHSCRWPMRATAARRPILPNDQMHALHYNVYVSRAAERRWSAESDAGEATLPRARRAPAAASALHDDRRRRDVSSADGRRASPHRYPRAQRRRRLACSIPIATPWTPRSSTGWAPPITTK